MLFTISTEIRVVNGKIEEALKKLGNAYSKELKEDVKTRASGHMTRGQKHRRQMMRSKARNREKIRIAQLRGEVV